MWFKSKVGHHYAQSSPTPLRPIPYPAPSRPVQGTRDFTRPYAPTHVVSLRLTCPSHGASSKSSKKKKKKDVTSEANFCPKIIWAYLGLFGLISCKISAIFTYIIIHYHISYIMCHSIFWFTIPPTGTSQ
jgi:hypothetical protein